MPAKPAARKNPPATITVGPFVYEVVADAAVLALVAVAKDEGPLAGSLQADALRIVVDPDLPDGRLTETLLHETLHALMELVGLNRLLEDKEETVVLALAPALLDLLRRNPGLVGYLLGGDS